MQINRKEEMILALNRDELDKLIIEVEGKARVRRITSHDIIKAITKIEFAGAGEIDDGARFLVDVHAQYISPNYVGDLRSTQVELVNSGGDWYISKVMRTTASKHKVVMFNNPERPNPKLDARIKGIEL